MNSLKVYLIIGSIIALLFGSTVFLSNQLKKEKEEKELYKKNTSVLMDKIETYQTKDSLNVVSVGVLELKLSEYKKYRSDDLKLINSLNVDKKRLEQITSTQIQTIYELKGSVRDSLIYRDNYIIDTLKCITIHNTWFDLKGCSNRNNDFSGSFESRDSLIYIEHIVPKKFLFFKWGIKERKQEILSKNPNTKILNAEYISIRD
ncbi:DUF6549 family protein [Dysgonomonas sp. GY617]|uniref:DUF6549 family protein n=1 Tax=Dysgonomonas sp. GY617 TaxID=2780420 RepID=UPI0018845A3F|nr:DUF6549 family protein [Dysgonomonas sp. GY617]MBF0577749.1 hypothetical protein [Dysgonomonas sp. GY617]